MGLRTITRALLPRDYREQVLGDLAERGFRFRDALSVLPHIWWSAIRRSALVPSLASASDAVLSQRVRQFERRWIVAQLGILCASMSLGRGLSGTEGMWNGVLLFAASLAFCALFMLAPYRPPPLPVTREQLILHHREQLQKILARWGPRLLTLWIVTIAGGLWSTWSREASELPWRFTRSVAALALIYLLVRWKTRRARQELESMEALQ
jgi:hypothetical protein